MSRDEVSRRLVVGALGVGVAGFATAGGGVLARSAHGDRNRSDPGELGSEASGAPALTRDEASASAEALLAPLAAGSMLGRFKLERVLPIETGALSVILSDPMGRRFQLDVCARDLDAPARAPASSELFEVLLANRGDGALETEEEHGLAAMALAEVIRSNEHGVDRSSFLTLAERLRLDAARVHVT